MPAGTGRVRGEEKKRDQERERGSKRAKLPSNKLPPPGEKSGCQAPHDSSSHWPTHSHHQDNTAKPTSLCVPLSLSLSITLCNSTRCQKFPAKKPMAESDQEDSSYIWLEEPGGGGAGPPGGKLGKKRRFSEEQVKSLELMFETQAKLEPRKKLQLAKELGLHPRQVAIWFQNKRARWKSKQLEREYGALKADYDALLSSFESLKSEKQALAKQLHKLAEVFNKQVLEERGKEDEKVPWIEKSDDEENRDGGGFGEKEELGLHAEPAADDETLASSEQHFLLQPTWPTPTSSQWWDFWPMNG